MKNKRRRTKKQKQRETRKIGGRRRGNREER